MSNVHGYLKTLKDGANSIRSIGIPSVFEMDRIQECIDGLFSFAKFKVGDTVEMDDTYPVNVKDSWGWVHCRHLLKKGSKAVVEEIDFSGGTFVYLVAFLEQTWIDDKNVVHPSSNATTLNLREKWLKASNHKKNKK